jgi:Tol biopolymer transport system component
MTIRYQVSFRKKTLANNEASPELAGIPVYGTALSADGQWVAFQEHEFGRDAPWISVARLDGSERRLITRMDGRWLSMNPVWSPDGKWLLISVLDTQDWSRAFGVNVLVNPTTCEVIPLPGLDGVIKKWIP